MTLPTITVEVGFSTNPTEATTWTDISGYVRTFSTRRGRNFELDQIQTGTATLLLDNRDRRFDPNHSGGPYFPNVRRMRRLRIRATYASITYDVFTGYVEQWPQVYRAKDIAEVPISVVDGFAVLAMKKLNTSYAEQRSDLRVHEVLDDVSWTTGNSWVLDSSVNSVLGTTTILGPNGDRLIGEGQSTLQASTLSKARALQHLQDVQASENGLIFVGKDGSVVFHGRHRRIKPPYTQSRATFGDGSGELGYADILLDDDTPVWNEVTLQRTGGTEQSASDQTSKDRYFPRSYSDTTLLLTSDSEVLDAANWLLGRYKEPGLRVAGMVIKGSSDPANLWPVVLNLEIGERVTLKRRPPGGGSAISQESFIEGIEHQADALHGTWSTTFRLSPADTNTYWILDDTLASVLGTTTRLAY